MMIAITGTPGVGKTSVAKILAKKLDADYISLSAVAKNVKSGYDRKRKAKIVAISDLKKAVKKPADKKRNSVIDGHLSHFLGADIVFVLRCNPAELRRRMKRKGWNKAKIRENLEAEMVDACTIEAVERHGRNVFEIDASKTKPEAAARLILKVLNNHALRKKYSPRIDWTEKYAKEIAGD